jgi:hypothetical protein
VCKRCWRYFLPPSQYAIALQLIAFLLTHRNRTLESGIVRRTNRLPETPLRSYPVKF